MGRMKGPVDGEIIAVLSRANGEFKDTVVTLGISMDNTAATGENLKQTLRLMNALGIKRLRILVGDALSGINMKCFIADSGEARRKGIEKGTAWIEKNIINNKSLLQDLKFSYETIRWDDILKNSSFETILQCVNGLLDDLGQADIQKAFGDAKEAHVRKKMGKEGLKPNPDTEVYQQYLTKADAYIREDIAGILTDAVDFFAKNPEVAKYSFTYPGDIFQLLQLLANKVLERGKIFKCHSISFRKVSQEILDAHLQGQPTTEKEALSLQQEYRERQKRLTEEVKRIVHVEGDANRYLIAQAGLLGLQAKLARARSKVVAAEVVGDEKSKQKYKKQELRYIMRLEQLQEYESDKSDVESSLSSSSSSEDERKPRLPVLTLAAASVPIRHRGLSDVSSDADSLLKRPRSAPAPRSPRSPSP
jgi:hypothetical protein